MTHRRRFLQKTRAREWRHFISSLLFKQHI